MEENNQQQKIGFLNLIVLILTIYVLGAMLVDLFVKLPQETSRVINIIDDCICVFFLVEFFIRLYKAENKMEFMRWGWIDLVASIPVITYLRVGRVLRLIRLLRIVRTFRTTRHFIHHIFRNKVEGTFTSVIILTILLIIFSAIGILQVETDPESNIKTAGDALYWAYVSVVTAGYDDKYPVTWEGRFIGIALMTMGVALYGTFSGFIASWFVAGQKQEDKKTEDQPAN